MRRRRGGGLPRRAAPRLPRRPPAGARRPRAASSAIAKDFFDAFGWSTLLHDTLEADDLLGSLARVEAEAGGEALLFTGDRDMFQCVGERVTVLFPKSGAKDGPEEIGPAEVRKRYGIPPELVPDFIALRGDPSDGIPGAKGIGEKTARDLLLDARDARGRDRQRRRASARACSRRLREQADELRAFKEMATLRRRPGGAPAGSPDRLPRRRGRGARAWHEPPRRAPRAACSRRLS